MGTFIYTQQKKRTRVSDFPKRLILFGICMDRILDSDILRSGAAKDGWGFGAGTGAALTLAGAALSPVLPLFEAADEVEAGKRVAVAQDGIDE